METTKYIFNDIVIGEEGLLKGPFGSDLKKELYVPKGEDTYKVYLQENILKQNNIPGEHYISKDYYEKSMKRYAVKEGDFIVTCDGTLGEIFQLKNLTEPGIISSSLLRITLDKKKCDEKFFPYFFKAKMKMPLITQANNSVLKHLPGLTNIRNFSIDLPLLTTQKKIASVLSALDDKIALNKKMNQKLEAMAKRLYDYWFVQYDFPDKNGHPYKTTGGSMTYNETLKREIPVGWEIKKLEECINLFDSKRIPLSSQQRASKKGVIPYYGATGIMDYVDDFIYDGEYILLAEDGSVETDDGFVIIQRIWGKTWVNNHAHVIQPKENGQYEFYYQVLSSIVAKKITTGSIQKKISQENMNAYKLLSPPKDLVLRYSLLVHDSWEKQKKIVEENVKLQNLRDKLLPLLMNGQVTVA